MEGVGIPFTADFSWFDDLPKVQQVAVLHVAEAFITRKNADIISGEGGTGSDAIPLERYREILDSMRPTTDVSALMGTLGLVTINEADNTATMTPKLESLHVFLPLQ